MSSKFYYLPVKVLNRRVAIVSSNIKSRTHRFIYESNNNNPFEICSWILEKDNSIYSDLYNHHVLTEIEDNIYKIILTDQQLENSSESEFVQKIETKNDIIFKIKYRKSEVQKEVEVQFYFQSGNERRSGSKFNIYFPHSNDKVIKSALDFGSEASQIIQKKQDSISSTLVPSKMEDLLSSLPTLGVNFKFDDYIQSSNESDSDNDKFLKSVFFYQSSSAQSNDNLYPSSHYFKFLTREDEVGGFFSDTQHQYKILPNLKLGYINLNEFKVRFANGEKFDGEDFIVNTKKLILSNFIESLIHYNKSDNLNYFYFTLLYPNVYDQKTINKVHDELDDIFLNKLTANKISGYELSMLSESDAVFLGYKHKYYEKIKPNAEYVVIDSGKGTTDYSIISTGMDKNQFITKFRTGFVGAGNLITFSFLVAIIHDIAKDKGLDFNTVSTKLLKEHLSIDKFFTISNKLNELKYGYVSGGNHSTSFTNLNLDSISIVNVLDSIKSLQDYGGYIHAALSYIIQKIKKDLNPYINNSTQIILSGRAFKFKPYLDALKKQLDNKNIHFIEEAPKTIALLGAFTSDSISSMAIEGVPRLLDKSEVYEKNPSKNTSSPRWWENIKNKLAEETNQAPDLDYEFIIHGKEVDSEMISKIFCSNTIYDIPNSLTNDLESNSKIKNPQSDRVFFNGDSYLIISNGNEYDLVKSYDIFSETEKSVNKFSLFPFINEGDFLKYVNDFESFLRKHYTAEEEVDINEDMIDISL